ncbi:uncharacterized protein B0H18DRAFT_247822 [Fomitopsis serialis]|uniref:uncharacterized protein n=1 Tax=Fomitopsis serialis TaxID=139415 RepID=UPI0020084D1B|nr:uncharacterized protein B0H18DRAFT_247822 [Neoantrodia serialis]KAH9912560.1 hypothetical protein B0H18DRAFT_247822 [Neoantrodia serialis]
MITDYLDETILGNLKQNVGRNACHVAPGCTVHCRGYEWGHDPSPLLYVHRSILPASQLPARSSRPTSCVRPRTPVVTSLAPSSSSLPSILPSSLLQTRSASCSDSTSAAHPALSHFRFPSRAHSLSLTCPSRPPACSPVLFSTG